MSGRRCHVDLCEPCTVKIHAVLDAEGEQAMIEGLAETLCVRCRHAIRRLMGLSATESFRCELRRPN